MGVIIGVIVGYVMGAKAGEKGLEEIKDAWATIRASEEARDIVAGGLSMARNMLAKGGEMLVERLQSQAGSSGSASGSALRPTG